MSKQYDLVVFGASGFTGKHVLAELFRKKYHEDFRIAIAGRSAHNLQGALTWVTSYKSVEGNAAIIEADTNDYSSLLAMCQQTHTLLNCVGPFRFHGEPVVRACIEGGCDYLDITGEPEFMERIRTKYNDSAIDKGVYIILACGFDCVPSELGMIFAKENFHGTLGVVENYFHLTKGRRGITGNYGTYSSLVNSISNVSSLRSARKLRATGRVPVCGPKVHLKHVHYDKEEGSYALAFFGADVSVVKKSQKFFYEHYHEVPAQFAMYFCCDFVTMICIILFLFMLKIMTSFSWGTKLLLDHPRFFSGGSFSKTGPTEQQIAEAGFKFIMRCKGYENALNIDESDISAPYDSEMVIGVSGPEIGYALTSISLVQSSCCLIREKEFLPGHGGVYTPGPAFHDTSLIKRLGENGINFKVLKSQRKMQKAEQ